MLGRRLMSAAVIISATLLLLYFDFRMGADDWLGRPGIVLAILIGIIGFLIDIGIRWLETWLVPWKGKI